MQKVDCQTAPKKCCIWWDGNTCVDIVVISVTIAVITVTIAVITVTIAVINVTIAVITVAMMTGAALGSFD